VIFNPFSFASAGRAARIDNQLRFDDGASASVSIRPEPCATRAKTDPAAHRARPGLRQLRFLSHHRRQTHQYAEDLRAFGVFDNWYRFRRGSARVKKGDRVQAGQVIAQIGNSGATPVPHLHYELRTGWGRRRPVQRANSCAAASKSLLTCFDGAAEVT
jgi:hypothetical protein